MGGIFLRESGISSGEKIFATCLVTEKNSSCKSILRVCAFTYVIGSLTSILNVRNIWVLFRAVIFRR